MKIISKTGDSRFAEVYVAQMREEKDSLIEFVDARDPRYPKAEKWVVIVSTQIGCPIYRSFLSFLHPHVEEGGVRPHSRSAGPSKTSSRFAQGQAPADESRTMMLIFRHPSTSSGHGF